MFFGAVFTYKDFNFPYKINFRGDASFGIRLATVQRALSVRYTYSIVPLAFTLVLLTCF